MSLARGQRRRRRRPKHSLQSTHPCNTPTHFNLIYKLPHGTSSSSIYIITILIIITIMIIIKILIIIIIIIATIIAIIIAIIIEITITIIVST